jgi:hypothetical protein
MEDLKETLDKRGGSYGSFKTQAFVARQLKEIARSRLSTNQNYHNLDAAQKAVVDEGLDMILHKISRIVNGDPLFEDSWIDIAGYATITARDTRK